MNTLSSSVSTRFFQILHFGGDLENRRLQTDVEITWRKKPFSKSAHQLATCQLIHDLIHVHEIPSARSSVSSYPWMVDDPIYTYVRPYGTAVYYKSVLFNWSTLKKNEEGIKETKEEIYIIHNVRKNNKKEKKKKNQRGNKTKKETTKYQIEERSK